MTIFFKKNLEDDKIVYIIIFRVLHIYILHCLGGIDGIVAPDLYIRPAFSPFNYQAEESTAQAVKNTCKKLPFTLCSLVEGNPFVLWPVTINLGE